MECMEEEEKEEEEEEEECGRRAARGVRVVCIVDVRWWMCDDGCAMMDA